MQRSAVETARALALCAFLSACAGAAVTPLPPDPDRTAEPAADTCGAAALQGLVGQPATALERVLIMAPIRLIRPGMMVTMDYSPERLNVEIDVSERITAIRCG